MSEAPRDNTDHHCPHLDAGDRRCNHRFTMATVESAFAVCCNAYHGCTTFHRINMEQSHGTLENPLAKRRLAPRPAAGSMPVQVTAHGRNLSLRSRGA